MTGKKRGLRHRERGDETETLSKFSGSDTDEGPSEQVQLSENTCENVRENTNTFPFVCSVPTEQLESTDRGDRRIAERPAVRTEERTEEREGNTTFLNPYNLNITRTAPMVPITLETQELKSAMKEMTSSIVESIRESNKNINDNLRGLASTMQLGSSQSNETTQSTQPQVRKEVRRSRASRRRDRAILRHNRDSSGSSDSAENDIGLSRSTDSSLTSRHRSYTYYDSVKLPNYTGKESWKVWFNRFTEIADRKRWSNEKKLDELLPRLQGAAGEFVFGQLQKTARGNYDILVAELNSRFRVVETKKTFGAQFSKRNQKVSETTEEYAAELKRLYDKAYAKRDSETRQEDLLRRFLDGLYDDKARFQVEYVKEPKTIDEAVFYVVDFEETKRKPTAYEGSDKKYKRPVRNVNFSDSESEFSDIEISGKNQTCTREKPIRKANNYGGPVNNKDNSSQSTGKGREQGLNSQQKKGHGPKIVSQDIEKGKIENWISEILQKISKLENERNSSCAMGQSESRNGRSMEHIQCYSCKHFGHFSRNCPFKVDNSGQNKGTGNPTEKQNLGPRHNQAQNGNGSQVSTGDLNF